VGDVFSYSFTMERGDFLALNHVLAGRSLWRPLFILVFYFAVIAGGVLAGVNGDTAAFGEVARQIGTGTAPVWIYPLLLLGPLLVLLRPAYQRFLAGHAYRRSPLADRRLAYRFASDVIQGGIPELQSRFPWNTIRRIIVTPEHAFLIISRREALIIPRRIVETDEDFDTLLAFARARIAAARR
jgi:hypothetical protein